MSNIRMAMRSRIRQLGIIGFIMGVAFLHVGFYNPKSTFIPN